ncbi:hypothetical protein COW36_09990 [bacterium (Candidatus Blackallbacteria) CG17_big_fil_post_rev_8_21_14_2_50_48_46]|uniref:Uncharacterized protein n=1 Tax=bacterium (Candidatus Blackallbacteria) CG17_big_fil_post_rev_8_21_14_2_50_48_46 TaxID=2014261 RepID=A0A2M7G5A2_9BACT|nr:MAG: hypothetical protein COW64_13900 [bacterium (Candidatus Blackallbacteria) CG18_big_fil_WC_8_21_14_2_50_49_26]PIW17129.1 MAG: hypothetical protein COW36_09990 [bacterium (Candidatus Blackallbacteria) CG17_big_fil_post_rev_8_21_14_2_50_48_46]PIW47823.1 MAG: hypothetical protein COW20_11220 [bacterium (Candidatus Blackallbacteria) CG13_big_fil_rev_8_21_14_2_50_49_14]
MASKIYQLKEQIAQNIPPGEVPRTIYSRLMLKTGLIWAAIAPDTEVTEEQYVKAVKAAQDILGLVIQG